MPFDRMLSDEDIVAKWKDLSFPGSFYSAHTFYAELCRHYTAVPSYQHILQVLKTIPIYQIHAAFRDTKYFRHLDLVSGQGISVQIDLAFLPPFNKQIGFIIIVDIWNNFLYTVPFQTKKASEIGALLADLFSSPPLQHLAVVSSDSGGEFLPLAKKFGAKDIKWIFLKSKTKAFLAELFIKVNI